MPWEHLCALDGSADAADLDRFAFLLGGNDGEALFPPEPGPYA